MKKRKTTEVKSDLQNETEEERIERLKTYIKLYQNPPRDDPFEHARNPVVIPGTEPYVYSLGEEDELLKQEEALLKQPKSDTTNVTKTDVQKDDNGLIALIKKFRGPPIKRTQTVSTSNQSIFNKQHKNNNDHLVDTTNEFCFTNSEGRRVFTE